MQGADMTETAKRDSFPRHQVVATVVSTVAAIIASTTAVMTSVQASHAIQSQAQMAIFQHQLESCLGYAKSTRVFDQKFALAAGMTAMRLKDDQPTAEKEKMFLDVVNDLTGAAESLVEATDEIRLVIPDAKVQQTTEKSHQLATQAVLAWQSGYKDTQKLTAVMPLEEATEKSFETAKQACRTYLADVMGGNRNIR
jgi:hypothetical protein